VGNPFVVVVSLGSGVVIRCPLSVELDWSMRYTVAELEVDVMA
jgi:hypothetical protein